MKTIMGVDASTTTIGIAILTDDNGLTKLKYSEYYKPNKKVSKLEMYIAAQRYVVDLADDFKIDEFVIEEYAKFMKGNSTAKTIIPLAILNTYIQIGVLQGLKIQPQVLNVMKIRHTLKKSKTLPAKEEMPDLVADHLGIDFPWVKWRGKRRSENWDVADAIAVALAYIKIQSSPKPKPRSKKRKK
jgi:Holliday junction resolvasome RuvABC endonuclease subunit